MEFCMTKYSNAIINLFMHILFEFIIIFQQFNIYGLKNYFLLNKRYYQTKTK